MKVIEMQKQNSDHTWYGLTIEIDGEQAFSAGDGDPEDSSLCRNFSDCYKILDIIKAAHKAGASGEPLEIEQITAGSD